MLHTVITEEVFRMSLDDEWLKRIQIWRNELPRHFYRPLGRVELAGFVTYAQLTAAEAAQGVFTSMPAGTKWGAKWEYAWFRGGVVLPAAAQGERIVARIDTGGESAIYVNGRNAGATDAEHREVTLTRQGMSGVRYQIMAESYAGHGPRVRHVPPVTPEAVPVPEPPAAQVEVGESTFGIWDEECYQLWLDVNTLFELRDCLEPDSLRVAEIDRSLKEFTLTVDLELPYAAMSATVKAGRAKLQPLLACVNGSTAPILFAFGHSHIDLAWLWPLTETERKCTRTFGTQLALLEEYPEYIYLQSQPYLYAQLQQHYPDLYERIKARVQQGRIIPDGGMWVEADTNLSGGESLVRQFLHGKKYFKTEFGVENELLWLPDVFGYSGALPQIMRGCGIRYFATAKIFWAYGNAEPFPYNTFYWEGIDGSRVLAHMCNDYNSHTNPATLAKRWKERVQKDDLYSRMLPFGHGDGGGGATRDHLEYLRRAQNLEGLPKTKITAPVEFFKDLECNGIPDVTYVGELYFAAHRGTYTSQARTKKGNRQSELCLREAELWQAAASVLRERAYPQAELEQAWKSVLLNQFHDIIPGSSIHRVYEEAEAAYARVIETTRTLARQAWQALVAEEPTALTIFNSLAWPRQELVEVPAGFGGLVDAGERYFPGQAVAGKILAEVKVPACGWSSYRPVQNGVAEVNGHSVQAGANWLENEWLRVELNEFGELVSILDKETGRELALGPCNSFKMYKDVPTSYDAWDIDSMYEQLPVALTATARLEVLANGPLVAQVAVTRTLHNSPLTQIISLRRGSRRVEFRTRIDWRERHKLLKVNFPVTIYAPEALNEIQFGHVKRPTHKSKRGDANKFEVCNHKWTALAETGRGFAILNDCKYGVNVAGNSINLTLLKAPLAPDMTADQGLQEFTYACYAWNGTFAASNVIREAYELNIPVRTTAGYADSVSLFALDTPEIILETVKLAEDGSGDLIVRLYEAKNSTVNCVLTTALPFTKAFRTNLLEQEPVELSVDASRIKLEFRPFEIKTIRLQR
jgi:alpha-mannosidase